MKALKLSDDGTSLLELIVSMTIFAIISIGAISLFISLVHSAITAKQVAVASALATNQMEYLKSLPYDNLAVSGGSIVSSSYIPASVTKTLDGVSYVVKTSVSYVDDAYDGCGSYPNATLKATYCRNYPAPSGAPATDTNPADYKFANVSVYNKFTNKLASVDTQISARVAETASTTGAMFIKVIDANGNPLSGASVTVTNNTLTPRINAGDSTDTNGIAIFYGFPPDNGYDYVVTASLTGYSSLTTIIPNGALQPTYPNQKIITQASSSATLTLKPQGPNSLIIETTDTAGSPLGSVKVYVKGGYKKYTASSDTAYYYDTMTPSDTRPVTNSSGLTALSDLVPGNYIFCGDTGATGCAVGNTTYYLAAALPYAGTNPFNPIAVPTYSATSPPATTFTYNGSSYYQQVRLMLTTSSSFPRITSLSPSDPSMSSGTIGSFAFTVKGNNLPCSATASSCATTIRFIQGSSTYTATCTGASAGVQLSCSINLSAASTGSMQMQVVANGNTLTMPVAPPMGGFNVIP